MEKAPDEFHPELIEYGKRNEVSEYHPIDGDHDSRAPEQGHRSLLHFSVAGMVQNTPTEGKSPHAFGGHQGHDGRHQEAVSVDYGSTSPHHARASS